MQTIKYLFPFFILFLLSCNDNEPFEVDNSCAEIIDGENFAISNSTKGFLSNYFNGSIVVFENLISEEEIAFEITTALDTIIEYQNTTECPEDPNRISVLKGLAEMRVVQLKHLVTEQIISIIHRTDLNQAGSWDSKEQIFVVEGELNEEYSVLSANSGLLLLTPDLEAPLYSIKNDILTIGNRAFNEVYEIGSSNSGYSDTFLNKNLSILYSKNEGIVYINDKISNTEMVFDRIE